jgi:hypothetical protein
MSYSILFLIPVTSNRAITKYMMASGSAVNTAATDCKRLETPLANQ